MAQPADVWQPPAGAVRNAELEAWEVSERDESGLRHGACTLYRDDGSLLLRCRYERDRRSGDFESYHPNGELESRGRYVEGQLDGPFQRFASGNAGSTPLRGCCVPPGARELRVTYHRGASLGEVFFDGEGRALRSDGTLRPAPAPGVPDEATFDEGSEQWVLRTTSEAGVLLRKSFDLQGRPVEEREIAGGQVSLQRQFAASGVVAREHRFDENGEFHGRCLLRFVEGDGPYSNPAIREVHGAYEHGESIGAWRFFDDEGRELAVQERGEASSDERLADLVARDATNDEPGALLDEAVRLSSRGHVREALLLAARVTSRTGDVRPLRELLDARVVPLERSVAEVQANAFPRLDRPTLRKGLDCLLSGADPAEILRALATLVPSERSLARDLAEAASLLDPDSRRALVTRALIRLEQGDDEGALRDVALFGPELDDAAAQMRELARAIYPAFVFVPASEPVLEPEGELAPVEADQPLDAVLRTIGLYATRLGIVRDELVRRLARESAWLPPHLASLLPSGPVDLRRFTATITDEDENGSETSEVEIDELVDLGASAAALMGIARADWDALCWLCWASGLEGVALPASLVSRPNFAAAVNDAMHRCFRAHDQVRTGGLISRSRRLAGFTWDDLPIETLSPRLAELAARQYRERRAMFLWLMFPENLSPFQSDLRRV